MRRTGRARTPWNAPPLRRPRLTTAAAATHVFTRRAARAASPDRLSATFSGPC